MVNRSVPLSLAALLLAAAAVAISVLSGRPSAEQVAIEKQADAELAHRLTRIERQLHDLSRQTAAKPTPTPERVDAGALADPADLSSAIEDLSRRIEAIEGRQEGGRGGEAEDPLGNLAGILAARGLSVEPGDIGASAQHLEILGQVVLDKTLPELDRLDAFWGIQMLDDSLLSRDQITSIADLARDSGNEDVRLRAWHQLFGAWGQGGGIGARLLDAAQSDPSADVRGAALGQLSNFAAIDPSSRAAIQQMAEHDASPELRFMARQILRDLEDE